MTRNVVGGPTGTVSRMVFRASYISGLALLVASGSGWSSEFHRFTTEDMLDIVDVGEESLALSPGGRSLAFVRTDVKDERNVLGRRLRGSIRIVDLTKDAGGEVRQLSEGATRTSFPSWSPDGTRLAYFVEDSGGSRLEIWDAETDQTKRVSSSFPGEPYLPPQWDSSGNRIIFARAVSNGPSDDYPFLPPPTFARAAREHDGGEFPRVVALSSGDERIPGDSAFIDSRRAILTVFDLSKGRETALTEEPVYLRDFKVSPGQPYVIFTAPTAESFGLIGEEVLETFLVALNGGEQPRAFGGHGERFDWNPTGDALFYLENGALFSMALDGDRAQVFSSSEALKDISFYSLKWSPDGRWIAALVADESYEDPEIERPRERMYTIAQPFLNLYLVAVPEGEIYPITINGGAKVSVGSVVWATDGSKVMFEGANVESLDESVYKYELESQNLERLTDGGELIGDLESQGNTLLFTAEQADHPTDIYAIDIGNDSRRRIVALNPQLSQFEFSVPELFHYTNLDGETTGALLYRPVDVSPSAKVPVITYVYEKMTPWRHRFSARHQIFLNNGFAILMPNVKIRVGEPGTSYVKNVIPATNAVRSMGFTNGKFGIWGGSFGAYATSYLITQTNTFECAVARATPPELFGNWASGRDRDSQNIERGQARIGGSPYEVMERYLAQSAFFHLDKVETPVLIMHGAQDRTILFDEGEMLFYALRQLGKEATFVAYTHGDHSLYRHSRVDALDVHRRLLNWFEDCLN
jgi:dipeptidyl aminopeptidase/acylaminoacyl peptidase